MDRYLHDTSQYSYKNGESSCTYISLEACIRFLSSTVLEEACSYNVQNLSSLIEDILVCGISIDQGKGHRSCDETIASNERLSSLLQNEKLFIAKLKDDKTFMQLLRELEVIAQTNSEKKVCCVFTKPPETICIGHIVNNKLPFDFFIFDSHPRGNATLAGIFSPNGNRGPGNGAGFYFFKDIQTIEKYLKRLFPHQTAREYQNEYNFDAYSSHAHAMFEATIVTLKTKAVSPPAELHTNKPQLHKDIQQQQQQQQQVTLQKQLDMFRNAPDGRFLNVTEQKPLADTVHQHPPQSRSPSPRNESIPPRTLIEENKALKDKNDKLSQQVSSLQLQLAQQFDVNKKLRTDMENLGGMLRKLNEENINFKSLLNKQGFN